MNFTAANSKSAAKTWKQAEAEAFDAGRWYFPTAFAPRGSSHHRKHGGAR
jgi:hypothetical protein